MPALTDVRSVAAGESHGIAILNDGTVKAWGKNTYGQLGINSTTDTTAPVDIPGIDGVKQIAAGQHHSIALMDDGTVKAWGKNTYGQLGLGDNVDRPTPVTIPGLAGVKQIAAGYNSSYAVMNDGTVKAWGYNGVGRLGLGDYEDRKSPVTIPDLLDVWYITSGAFHVFAHTADGNIKAWGKNSYGQLGLGDNIDRNKPELVSEISGVRKIVAGIDFTAVLMNNGTVKTWGYNANGQLGLGNNKDQVYPQIVPELEDVKYINIGGAYAFAVLNDGKMKYWGKKIGDVGNVNVPTEIIINGLKTNSSPVMGINYPSSYTEEGIKPSVLGIDGNCESTTGWSGGNATVALDTPAKLYGGNAIKGSITASGVGYVYRNVKSILDNTKCYFISAYTKSGSTNSVNLYCNFGTEKNATVNATTAYARRGIKIKPSDMGAATEYRVGLKLNTGTAAQYGFIDNLIIVEITQDEYDKLNEAQLMSKYSYKNLLESDGDCEELGAWNAKTGTATLDTTNKVVGNNSIKIVSNSGTDTGLEKYLVPLDTSKYYLLSGYGKSSSGGNLNILIGSTYGLDTGGGATGTFTSSTFIRKGCTFKPTSSTGVLSLVASAITGQQHTSYFDGIMLKEISQNEYDTLSVEQLLERYPYESSKTQFAANIMMPATIKMKSEDNNVVISVSDVDNDVLTCSLYVDDESVARDTKIVSNSWQEQDVNLTLGSLADGDHLIKVEVWDGKETVQYSVNAFTMQRIKEIVQGTMSSYAIMEDGTVKAWGRNNYGQLGLGDNEERLYPTLIPGLLNVKKIVASSNTAYAIMEDGSVKAWGNNYDGQLGLGYKGENIHSPTKIESIGNVKDIVSDGASTYAILNDGYVMWWGANPYVHLGITSGSYYELSPTKINDISNADMVYTYRGSTYVKCGDKLYLWGYNGPGDTSSYSIYHNPILVQQNVKDFKVYDYCQFAIKDNGKIYVWGNNKDGYLGIGSSTSYYNYNSGVEISGISNAKKLFGIHDSTFVLCDNGDVWAWGNNSSGQLGLGDQVKKITPAKVDAFYCAREIVSRSSNTFAIFNDYIKVVGGNSNGVLGIGSKGLLLQPQTVNLSNEISKINFINNIYATFNDGSIKGWGPSYLGLGDNNERLVPNNLFQGTSMPTITSTSLKNNQIVNLAEDALNLSITVYDNDNDILDLKCYLDNSQVPYFNQKISPNTVRTQRIQINSTNITNLAQGSHSIKIELSDAIAVTTAVINFVYDQKPTNSLINVSSATNTITINASGTDSMGLDPMPYRFNISGTNNNWQEASESIKINKISSSNFNENSCKIVKTDSGYIAGAWTGSKIDVFRSNDNGLNWTNIGYVNNVTSGDYSFSAKGNIVYCSFRSDASPYYYVKFVKFDSQSLSGVSEILGAINVYSESSIISKGNGISITADNSNNIYLAYGVGNGGLRYNTSTDGTSWGTGTDLVGKDSNLYRKCSEPVILIGSNGYPYIVYNYQYVGGSGTGYRNNKMIKSFFYNGTSWISSNTFDGRDYLLSSPTAFLDKSGKIYAAWLAYDKTDNARYNVFYSSSNDGRIWSQSVKLTSGNTYDCSNPTIFVDASNRIYVAWTRNSEIEKVIYNKTWGAIEKLAKGIYCNSPSFCANSKDLVYPVMVYRSNGVNFVEFRSGSTSYTFNNLQPGTKYTVKFETRDISGNITVSTKDVYTKAALPSITIATKTATTANITITDSNGVDTKYKVKIGDKFLLADGTLSTKADLITSKSIKIKGLKPNATYQLYLKAVNGENIETKYSSAVSLSTTNTVPGVPANIKTASYGTNVKVSWDELADAQSYDVEIDSVVYTGATTSTSYVKTGLMAGISHNVRVRGVNTAGAGTWSSIYATNVVASKSNQIPVNYSVGKIFNIVLSAGNLKDADICTFKLTYDPAKLEVLDLCADTLDKELSTGDIVDTGIKVIEFNPTTGVIRYTVTKSANDGAAWTGALNSVKFRSKSVTPSTITYILE
jgi:alpha-tubulin suppressor-like RCC1 family protein